MKQTSVDWLFQQLWETPKDKLTWHSILEKAKQMENKHTAVQWLVEKIQHANPSFKFDALIRQAKQMEKEQIIDAMIKASLIKGVMKMQNNTTTKTINQNEKNNSYPKRKR